MLPILYKWTFETTTAKLMLGLLGVAIVAYGTWAGWRGAEKPEHRLWRALPFGVAAALLGVVGSSWAFPPMSAGLGQGIRIATWILSGVLVVTMALYARRIAPKGDTNSVITYALMGAAAGAVAIKLGLGDTLGRGHGLPLHSYGLLLLTAFLTGMWLAGKRALAAFPGTMVVNGKRIEAGPYMRDHVLDLSFYLLMGGVVGSRILFVITKWDEYKHDLLQAFSPTGGGLVFYGGFIGAIIVAVIYTRMHKLPFLKVADVLIPALALGHAIGRLGCFSAGCCWGGIAKAGSAIAVRFPSAKNLPFGGFGTDSLAFGDQVKDERWVDALGHIHTTAVEGAHQISQVAASTGYTLPVYPTQIMESLGEILLLAGLLVLTRYKRFEGQILATWLMGYAILRTTIEFFRGDELRGYVFRFPEVDPLILSTSQTISLGIFALGVALWVRYGRRAQPKAA